MSDPIFKRIFNLVYPVGSIYLSVNSTNPQVLFGGTWVQLKDRFLIGTGDTYSNGATGGSATHKLTVSEMPSHNHSTNETGNHSHPIGAYPSGWEASGYGVGITGGFQNRIMVSTDTGQSTHDRGNHTHTITNSGGNGAHNNMPPYLAVYMWKRTA